MRRARKSCRGRRGGVRRNTSINIDLQDIPADNCLSERNPIFVSGDEASCDFEGFGTSSSSVKDGIKVELSSVSELTWDTFPGSMNPESVKNECLNSRTDSFKTLHESFSFEAEVPSEAGQTSWEAVFGDHNQLTDIVAPSFASTNKDQSVVSKSTLKSSPQTVGRVSVLLDRVKAEEGNNCTQVQDSSKVPISSTNLKICEVVKRRPRGRGRRRGKASRFSPMKAGKRELSDDKDELVDPAPIPVSLPDIKPVVTSPILQPVKRHRYALKFRERPEPFVMDPGYLRDLKYLELLRPKNIKEEHNLLTKLNMIYDRLGTDNFPQLLHGLRRKLIVRKEQRENGIPVFDFDAIEKFVSAHGRVPTNEERLRLEFIKARESGDSS